MSQHPYPHPGTPYLPPGTSSHTPLSNTTSPPPPPPKTAAPSHSHQASHSGQHQAQYEEDRRYSQQLASPPAPPPPLPPHPTQQQQQYYQPQSQYQQDEELYAQPEPRPQAHESHNSHLPPEGWLPDSIKDKSRQDLEKLLSDPQLLKALMHAPSTSHPSLQASTSALQQHLKANMTLASNVESLEQTLEQRRRATQQHLLAVRALEQQWRKKQTDLDQHLEAFGPRVLHQRLGQGIAEQEQMCAGLEESFLSADGMAEEREVGEWVRRVREARRTVILRRERRARWDEGRVGGWR